MKPGNPDTLVALPVGDAFFIKQLIWPSDSFDVFMKRGAVTEINKQMLAVFKERCSSRTSIV